MPKSSPAETTLNPNDPKKLFRFKYILLAGLALVASYAIVDRDMPVEILEQEVLNSPMPGDDLLIAIKVDRERACFTRTQNAVFDGNNVRFNSPMQEFERIGDPGIEEFVVRVPINEKASPGPAKVRFVNSWICNYVHIVWPLTQVRETKFTISAALTP